jgi:4-hydroxy-2-oxoglutarate aldolase
MHSPKVAKMRPSIRGIYAPVVTPFKAQQVDLDALGSNLIRYRDTPLAGVVILGSNGEAVMLDDDESDAVLVAARRAWPTERTLIAGTGRESTAATIAATRRAADAGADIAMVRTPSFFKARITSDCFIRHYEEVADHSPLPILLYNVTMFTGVSLPVEAAVRLAKHERIIGLKDSGSDLALLGEFINRPAAPFVVLAGSAPTLYPALAIGAAGAVLAVAGIVPDVCVRIQELVDAGRHDEAREWQRRLTPLAQAVGTRYGIPGLKVALTIAGYTGGEARLPLLPAPPEAEATIRAALDALHVHA